MSDVKPIPEGYHTVTPYLITDDPDALLAFTLAAFDAEVEEKLEEPGTGVVHAAVLIGNSHVMIGRASDGNPALPTMLYLYVEDCDAAYEKALAAGAESVLPPKDQFYGDRSGGVKDAAGNQWWFGTRIEDLTPEELAERAAAQPPN